MRRNFRPGALGALMDELERAAADLERFLDGVTDEQFLAVADADTEDADCHSMQTIMRHVVSASYAYANYFRDHFGIPARRPEPELRSREESILALRESLQYTEETLSGHWTMSYDAMAKELITTRWGAVITPELLYEHAVCHVLRHRRQCEKFLFWLAEGRH